MSTASPPPSNLAFVFPGQGSQYLGMLAELASEFSVVKATFDEASAGAGVDWWALSHQGPEETLNRTENTQPALLAAGVAVWRVWLEQGGSTPSVLAGHSLGEYTALVCAGALSLHDAAALVAAGLLSVIIFPALAVGLMRRESGDVETAAPEPAPQPRSADVEEPLAVDVLRGA